MGARPLLGWTDARRRCRQGTHIPHPLHRPLEEPKLISAFCGKQAGKRVVHIACGSTYSAAITAEGELYTWGRGNYGRLGHGEAARPARAHGAAASRGLTVTTVLCLKVPVKMRPFRCWWLGSRD